MNKPQKRSWTGKYDPKLKIAIAREYLSTDLGYLALSKKYKLPKGSVCDFVKWYLKKYPEGGVDCDNQELSTKIDKVHDETNLKITALEMLIENASKELGIDLVKKFGTKQPRK